MRPLCLLGVLSCAVVLIGPIQCLSRIALLAQHRSVSRTHQLSAIHTREEVSDRQIDFSRDGQHECAQTREPIEFQRHPAVGLDETEVEIALARRLLRLRVAPSSPDDDFHLA